MHIQDGYLSTGVCAATAVVSLAAVGYSLKRMKTSLADRTVPLTGMMASLIFAGQMVNFPIGLPVSGHLMGGVLAATVLGPWAACVALTLVLVAQWALFSDGGLLSLGANVLHMAVIGSIGGYAVQSTVRKLVGGGFRGILVGSVIAAWLSVMAAAALFCAEFRISHAGSRFDFGNIFVLMVTFHSLIGIGEALITGSVVGIIARQRPDLLYESDLAPAAQKLPFRRFLVAGTVCALAVGAFLSPFASEADDGLEAVAVRTGIAASDNAASGLFADYDRVPVALSGWQSLSVSIAGSGGALIVFALAVSMGRLLHLQPAPEPAGD